MTHLHYVSDFVGMFVGADFFLWIFSQDLANESGKCCLNKSVETSLKYEREDAEQNKYTVFINKKCNVILCLICISRKYSDE